MTDKPPLHVLEEDDLTHSSHDIDVIAFCNALGQWPPIPLTNSGEVAVGKGVDVMTPFLNMYWPKPAATLEDPKQDTERKPVRPHRMKSLRGMKLKLPSMSPGSPSAQIKGKLPKAVHETDGVLWMVQRIVLPGGRHNFQLEPEMPQSVSYVLPEWC